MRRGLWGVADHALVSGSNAASLLVLARVLSPPEFGRFVLAYTTLLLAYSIQTALVTQPHNVLGATRTGDDYRSYTTSTALAQLTLSGLLVVAAAVSAAVADVVGARGVPVLVALAAAALGWQLQEFARRVLYTEGRARAAFANDVISYGGQVAGIVALWRVGELTAARGLLTLAATSLLAAAVGAFQLRHSFSRVVARSTWRENWRFGKWLGGAAVMASAAVNLFFYSAAVLAGATAAGTLKAAQILLGPANVIILFLGTVLPIRLAQALHRAGHGAMRSEIGRALLLTGPAAGLYCLGTVVFADEVLRLLYGGRYEGSGGVVALFAVYVLLTYGAQVLAAALNALRRTRDVYRASVWSLVVAVTAGWVLVALFGATGGALGLIVAAAAGTVALVRSYDAARRGVAGADPTAARAEERG